MEQLSLFTVQELGETQEDVIARLLSGHGSLYGVRQWQKSDIGDGEAHYAALIKGVWRPLPVEFSVMQRRPEPCAMTRKALY